LAFKGAKLRKIKLLLGWSWDSYICSRSMKKTTLILTACLLAFFGCDDPDCISTAGEAVKIGFYSYPKDSARKVRVNRLQLAGSDIVLIATSADLSSVTLPLNPADTTITVIFDTEFGVDTVQIGYSVVSRIITENCGVEILYTNIKSLRSDFDSIRVVNSNVQINFKQPEVINENIRVYN
jgi:hypothetical protein